MAITDMSIYRESPTRKIAFKGGSIQRESIDGTYLTAIESPNRAGRVQVTRSDIQEIGNITGALQDSIVLYTKRHTAILREDGTGFTSLADCLAYLQALFDVATRFYTLDELNTGTEQDLLQARIGDIRQVILNSDVAYDDRPSADVGATADDNVTVSAPYVKTASGWSCVDHEAAQIIDGSTPTNGDGEVVIVAPRRYVVDTRDAPVVIRVSKDLTQAFTVYDGFGMFATNSCTLIYAEHNTAEVLAVVGVPHTAQVLDADGVTVLVPFVATVQQVDYVAPHSYDNATLGNNSDEVVFHYEITARRWCAFNNRDNARGFI